MLCHAAVDDHQPAEPRLVPPVRSVGLGQNRDLDLARLVLGHLREVNLFSEKPHDRLHYYTPYQCRYIMTHALAVFIGPYGRMQCHGNHSGGGVDGGTRLPYRELDKANGADRERGVAAKVHRRARAPGHTSARV